MEYLLDTNIVLIYARGNNLTKKIEEELQLLSADNQLVISVVTIGEIKSLAIKNNWGKRKVAKLGQLLNKFIVADINVEEITERYAEIDAYSQGKLPDKKGKFTSRNMGKNDLWIAATGSVLQVVIVTTDSDFDHLDGEYIKLKKVDIDSYR